MGGRWACRKVCETTGSLTTTGRFNVGREGRGAGGSTAMVRSRLQCTLLLAAPCCSCCCSGTVCCVDLSAASPSPLSQLNGLFSPLHSMQVRHSVSLRSLLSPMQAILTPPWLASFTDQSIYGHEAPCYSTNYSSRPFARIRGRRKIKKHAMHQDKESLSLGPRREARASPKLSSSSMQRRRPTRLPSYCSLPGDCGQGTWGFRDGCIALNGWTARKCVGGAADWGVVWLMTGTRRSGTCTLVSPLGPSLCRHCHWVVFMEGGTESYERSRWLEPFGRAVLAS